MPPPTAATLLRDVGLLADGPLPWGRPVPARTGGVFVVELPAPRPTAPIELTRVGKWLERVPDLRLDGTRPTSRALSARLASFWLPSQPVLYIGATEGSIGGRIAAMERTVLGDRRPHSGGHWLHLLTSLPTARVWWAVTDAVEEYEDALLAAFAAGVPEAERAALPDPSVVLPFANLRRPTGERKATGLHDSLLVEPTAPPPPPTSVIVLPDGDAEGARGEPPEPRRRTAAPRRPTDPRTGSGRAGTAAPPTATPGVAATLTAEGAARLQSELRELVEVRRPQVIGRIRSAKELGDLKENADYTAAREEQSFLEGRIQALEARLRDAVIAVVPVAGAGADLGSRLVVEIDGLETTYTLVGSAEADPGAGRLSIASPVGKALVGARGGDEVAVTTPRGAVLYRVISVE
jgi:transcription elongation factor GreA